MDRSSISSVDSEWDKSPSLPRQISPTGNDSSPAGNDSERYASLLAIARRHYVGKTRPPFAHFVKRVPSIPDITTERVIIALPDGSLPYSLSTASLADITCRTWNRRFFYRTLDIGENRCIVRLNTHPHRPKYREWLGVEDGESVWGAASGWRIESLAKMAWARRAVLWNRTNGLPCRKWHNEGLNDSAMRPGGEGDPVLLSCSTSHRFGERAPAKKKSRNVPRSHKAGRHIAVKHEGNEVTRTPAPRELSPSTSTIEREVSTSSPLTELESVTKRKQEIERQLEMIMALTNESRQLARREKELTRAASRSSGA